jgi:hypothetical protein
MQRRRAQPPPPINHTTFNVAIPVNPPRKIGHTHIIDVWALIALQSVVLILAWLVHYLGALCYQELQLPSLLGVITILGYLAWCIVLSQVLHFFYLKQVRVTLAQLRRANHKTLFDIFPGIELLQGFWPAILVVPITGVYFINNLITTLQAGATLGQLFVPIIAVSFWSWQVMILVYLVYGIFSFI